MLEQLLLSACEQAELSEPAVRAPALMHIARVMARSDQAAAEQLLDQGIALAETIEGDAPSLLLLNAICLAAAVSSSHALPLYAKHRQLDLFDGPVIALVNVMAQHGHIRDAITYLRDPCQETVSPYILSATSNKNATMTRPGGNCWNWLFRSGETLLPVNVMEKISPRWHLQDYSAVFGIFYLGKWPHPLQESWPTGLFR